MSWSFRRLCSLTALICLLLALAWGLAPGLLLTLWGLDYNPVAGFVARRNALLFLALAVIFHQFRDVGHSPARQALGNGMAIGCFALAGLGTLEWLNGNAGAGIFLAVGTELLLGLGFVQARRLP
ncbi:hypothetical protein [Pseudomonas piscis]|uniref:DUF4345 domain-containing protein n=1 Tax=Pseudomonas piscis TaxID=2614538 RepID=A0A7X1PN13_9PSED|nr:hypothetical protein [Pseudomonas piscis]MQA54145.1 hypothetical protein [Pseudomonas piscis]